MKNPKRIGPYEVAEELGRGAMGVVYRARDPRLSRDVALKVLWPHLAGEASFVERFKREARAAGGIEHPHVVRILDVGEAEGTHYIAMEYVRGETLRARMERPFTRDEALAWFRQIVEGLEAAHRVGLVHRDLKPGNILVEGETGLCKIADFGLARFTAEMTALTVSGEMMGTPEYLAPETLRGESADRRTDYYATGVILYRLLTGRLPFDGPTPAAILEAHQRGRYARPTEAAEGLPRQADAVVSKLMARAREDRYPDARSILDDLDRWGRGESVLPGILPKFEEIDEGLARRPPEWWRSAWMRAETWIKYQVAEVFGRTEETVLLLTEAMRGYETEFADARRRLEDAVILRDRIRRRVEAEERAGAEASARAEARLGAGEEDRARAELGEKVEAEKRRAGLENEGKEAEGLVGDARRAYEAAAGEYAKARHRSDLLLARRRRARLELSILEGLPPERRPTGAMVFALARLISLGISIGLGVTGGEVVRDRWRERTVFQATDRAAREALERDFRMAGYLEGIPLDAPIVFVDSRGTAEGDGTETRPYSTVTQGVAKVPEGGIVLVRAGEYRETVRIEKRLHLVGSGPDQTILAATENEVTLTLAAEATVSGFRFANPDGVRSSKGILIRGSGRAAHRIHHNVFRNQVVGIDVGDTISRPRILQNVFYDNYYAMTSNPFWRPVVANNIFYRNTFTVGSFGRLAAPSPIEDGFDTVVIAGNLVSANVTDMGFFDLTSARPITSPPRFLDAPENDFRLVPGSPAIDAGDPHFDRLGRFIGTHADIGAFEYDPSDTSLDRALRPPGVLIGEATEYFLIPILGPYTDLVAVSPSAIHHDAGAGEGMGSTRFDLREVRLHAPNRIERLFLFRSRQGEPAGYAALRFSMSGYVVGPEDVIPDTWWRLALPRAENALCDGISLAAVSGPEIELPDRILLDARRAGDGALIHPPTDMERRGTAFSFGAGETPETLRDKTRRVTLSEAAVFDATARPLPAAEAVLSLRAHEVLPEHLDRVFYLETGDVVFEIKVVDYIVSIFHAGNPDLVAAVGARRKFNRENFLSYFGSIAFRVRAYYRGPDRSISYARRGREGR